jgi:hypothetical protein
MGGKYTFAPLFSKPVWNHARTLAIGAILTTGKRTVTSALRVMGLRDEERFTNFQRVLNRAKRNTLQGAKIVLGLLIRLVPASLPLIILVDETIERRKGKKIKAKGCYRDSVRSTQKKVIHCSCNKANGKRHKTTVDWTRQMIMQVRRWLPYRAIVLVGDGAYAAVSLALCCAGFSVPVALVARFRLDASLYDFPPPKQPGKQGKKQRSLLARSPSNVTSWHVSFLMPSRSLFFVPDHKLSMPHQCSSPLSVQYL